MPSSPGDAAGADFGFFEVLRSRAGRSWELSAQWVAELLAKPDLIYLIFSE